MARAEKPWHPIDHAVVLALNELIEASSLSGRAITLRAGIGQTRFRGILDKSGSPPTVGEAVVIASVFNVTPRGLAQRAENRLDDVSE